MRVRTGMWKIKEKILKAIFKIRPHDSCKGGRNPCPGIQNQSFFLGGGVRGHWGHLHSGPLNQQVHTARMLCRAQRNSASQACHRESENHRKLVMESTQNPSCLLVSDKLEDHSHRLQNKEILILLPGSQWWQLEAVRDEKSQASSLLHHHIF